MGKRYNLKTLIAASSLLCGSAFANEQPSAESLVGKSYVGAHALYILTDSDRLIRASANSDIDYGYGIGGELGNRFTEEVEIRFSVSLLNLVDGRHKFTEPYGSSIAAEILYFPTAKNTYLLGGVDFLDIVDTEASLNLGLGYRHYMGQKSAIYLEGRGHHQFENDHEDVSIKAGFVYFFGDDSASQTASNAYKEITIAPLDADEDGVVDANDQCVETPSSNKVDEKGCSIFESKHINTSLLVNFEHGSAEVPSEYFPQIEKLADLLAENKELPLIIEGYASKAGPEKFNMRLSQKRADAVVDILVNHYSIDGRRLKAIGLGEKEAVSELGERDRKAEANVVLTKDVATLR